MRRLEQAFDKLDKTARSKKCPVMEGLIDEGGEIMKNAKAPDACDVGIIAASQKIEHDELASYGTLCQLAQDMGLDEVKSLLGQTPEEEKQTDQKLSQIAMSRVNPDAGHKEAA